MYSRLKFYFINFFVKTDDEEFITPIFVTTTRAVRKYVSLSISLNNFIYIYKFTLIYNKSETLNFFRLSNICK